MLSKQYIPSKLINNFLDKRHFDNDYNLKKPNLTTKSQDVCWLK